MPPKSRLTRSLSVVQEPSSVCCTGSPGEGASAQRLNGGPPFRPFAFSFLVPLCEKPHRAFGAAVQWRKQFRFASTTGGHLAERPLASRSKRRPFPGWIVFDVTGVLESCQFREAGRGSGPVWSWLDSQPAWGTSERLRKGKALVRAAACAAKGMLSSAALRVVGTETRDSALAGHPGGPKTSEKGPPGQQNHTRPLAIRHGAPTTWQVWFLEHCNMRRENGAGGEGGSLFDSLPTTGREQSVQGRLLELSRLMTEEVQRSGKVTCVNTHLPCRAGDTWASFCRHTTHTRRLIPVANPRGTSTAWMHRSDSHQSHLVDVLDGTRPLLGLTPQVYPSRSSSKIYQDTPISMSPDHCLLLLHQAPTAVQQATYI